jgi:hypothetical protein
MPNAKTWSTTSHHNEGDNVTSVSMRPGLRTNPGLYAAGVVTAVLGALTPISGLPTAVKSIALAAFVFVGIGSAVFVWIKNVPGYVRNTTIPLIGIAIVAGSTYLAALAHWWHPSALLEITVGAVVVSLAAGALSSRGVHE